MYNRHDPRFRRTLNTLTSNLEAATETTQVGLFSASEHYIKPCLASLSAALEPCTRSCFPSAEERRRRERERRVRGRAELNFDFYDDWEREGDEGDALLALGNEELNRLLGGEEAEAAATAGQGQQPSRRRRAMTYGSRGGRSPLARRKSAVGEVDPTVIPNQSYFGFLGRLPFGIGRRGLRYKPSAEGLRERGKEGGRGRTGTVSSGTTADSFSSRGDIFPSDEEDADAELLDDELAGVLLERREGGGDSGSSGRGSKGASASSKAVSVRSPRRRRQGEAEEGGGGMQTMEDLKKEEARTEVEEETEVEMKREAAKRLALDRGLGGKSDGHGYGGFEEDRKEEEIGSPGSPRSELAAMEDVAHAGEVAPVLASVVEAQMRAEDDAELELAEAPGREEYEPRDSDVD